MSPHTNRGRLTIDPAGAWRLCTNTLPADCTPLGTITRNGTDTGALVLMSKTGIYVQVNAGIIKTLPQAKVAAVMDGLA